MASVTQKPRVELNFSDTRDLNLEGLVSWLNQYPQRSDIHVYIPSRSKHSPTPLLRSTLQKLGCTVTAVAV